MARDKNADHHEAADRLNRYWDAFVRAAVHPGGRPLPTAEGADDLVHAVRRLHRLDDAPPPDGRFAAQLWQGLVTSHSTPPTAERAARHPVAREGRRIGLVHPVAGRRVLIELIAAAGIALAVLGGALDGRGPFPSLLGGSPTAAAHGAEATGGPARACAASPTPGPDRLVAGDGTAFPHAPAAVPTAPSDEVCGTPGG